MLRRRWGQIYGKDRTEENRPKIRSKSYSSQQSLEETPNPSSSSTLFKDLYLQLLASYI